MVNILLRKCASSLLNVTGIHQKRLLANKDNYIILAYHRVLEPKATKEYVEPGMYVRPRTFDMHMSLLKKKFTIVTLKELLSNSQVQSDKPKLAITFDDGWLDFKTNAFPILKRHNIPATIFLPTDYIGRGKWFWTDQLAHVYRNRLGMVEKSKIAWNVLNFKGLLSKKIEEGIFALKPFSCENAEEIVKKLGITTQDNYRVFLNWEECRELKESGLVTFGSHTANHIIMTAESEEKCHEELKISRERLISEGVVDSSFLPFCYPNGNFSTKYAHMVKSAKYSCAVTLVRGWNYDNNFPYVLKRIGMHQDMTSTKALTLARIINN